MSFAAPDASVQAHADSAAVPVAACLQEPCWLSAAVAD